MRGRTLRETIVNKKRKRKRGEREKEENERKRKMREVNLISQQLKNNEITH